MPHKDPEAVRRYFRERGRVQYRLHPERFRAASRKYHANNRETILANYSPLRNRAWRLQHEYGITLKEWNRMLARQGHRCAICRADSPGTSKGWHTDHNHVTGRVRGILCKNCNTALGLLGDDRQAVLKRIKIIKGYVR